MIATFDGLFVDENSNLYVYAFADNDGNNAGVNFPTFGPPTDADFTMAEPMQLSVAGSKIENIELVLDKLVTDSDFDGTADGPHPRR